MRAASQRIDDLDNVHMNRTLLQTPAAADAAENTVVIVREIDQLMQKPLPEAFYLRGSGLPCRHFRKIGVHAAVPAAKAPDGFAGVELLHVVALARRTYERTRAAAEAAFRKACPFRAVKQLLRLPRADAGQIELRKRQPFQNSMDFFLLRPHSVVRAVLQHGKAIGQRPSLFGVRLPVKIRFVHPAGNISRRLRRIDAEAAAEAGLVRSFAGKGDDRSRLAPGGIERVDRLL